MFEWVVNTPLHDPEKAKQYIIFLKIRSSKLLQLLRWASVSPWDNLRLRKPVTAWIEVWWVIPLEYLRNNDRD